MQIINVMPNCFGELLQLLDKCYFLDFNGWQLANFGRKGAADA